MKSDWKFPVGDLVKDGVMRLKTRREGLYQIHREQDGVHFLVLRILSSRPTKDREFPD
jgi:hypothetical protein